MGRIYLIIFISILSGIVWSCRETEPEGRINTVEFQIDSSYFDYTRLDTFHRAVLPHLKEWQFDTLVNDQLDKPGYIVRRDDTAVALILTSHNPRQPSSYSFYKQMVQDSSLGTLVLDLSNFVKNEIKLTQLIMKNENQTIFKIVYDDGVSAEELDIYIDNNQYNEKNIRLTESIIGQINFIKQ